MASPLPAARHYLVNAGIGVLGAITLYVAIRENFFQLGKPSVPAYPFALKPQKQQVPIQE